MYMFCYRWFCCRLFCCMSTDIHVHTAPEEFAKARDSRMWHGFNRAGEQQNLKMLLAVSRQGHLHRQGHSHRARRRQREPHGQELRLICRSSETQTSSRPAMRSLSALGVDILTSQLRLEIFCYSIYELRIAWLLRISTRAFVQIEWHFGSSWRLGPGP